MPLESTIICVDNSEYMRNEDIPPSRFLAQQDAVFLLCNTQLRSHPENDVGLISMSNLDVVCPLTSDVGKLYGLLHNVKLQGIIDLRRSLRLAQLVLQHRLGVNHKMRIFAFVGSPVTGNEESFVEIAKKLKKGNVTLDIINFGEDTHNNEILSIIIDTINGKTGTKSHLVDAGDLGEAVTTLLPDASSYQGRSAPTDESDEDLAYALQLSVQQYEQEVAGRTGNSEANVDADTLSEFEAMREEEAIAYAMNMSLLTNKDENKAVEDMTEDEAIALALNMSIQQGGATESGKESKDDDMEEDLDFEEMTEEEAIAYALKLSQENKKEPKNDKE